MTDIVDIFENIVDAMRATGPVDSIAEANGLSTIVAANTFEVRDSVILEGKTYLIVSATAGEFVVKAEGLTATEWKAAAPYYLYGVQREMSNILLDKDRAAEARWQKYPLVWLVLNAPRDAGVPTYDYKVRNLRLVIFTDTDPNYLAVDRKAASFDAVLTPLYLQLLEAMRDSGYFAESERLPHTATDNYYWGSTVGQGANIVDDHIDAIELRFNELTVLKTCN